LREGGTATYDTKYRQRAQNRGYWLVYGVSPRGMAQNIASLSGSFSNMIEC